MPRIPPRSGSYVVGWVGSTALCVLAAAAVLAQSDDAVGTLFVIVFGLFTLVSLWQLVASARVREGLLTVRRAFGTVSAPVAQVVGVGFSATRYGPLGAKRYTLHFWVQDDDPVLIRMPAPSLIALRRSAATALCSRVATGLGVPCVTDRNLSPGAVRVR